jgi:hypothetical protein
MSNADPAPAQIVGLSPTVLVFPNQILGTTSAPAIVTLTNSGTAALTFNGVSVSSTTITVGANTATVYYFAATSNCGATVAPGASCNISVTFTPYTPPILSSTTPAGSAPYTATVTIADNASTGPQTFAVSGNGIAPTPTLTPTAVTFPGSATALGTLVGTTSAPQSIYFENTGGAPLNIASIALGGANPANYAQTNNCPATLASLAACTINVTFSPTISTNTQPATVVITDNASTSPQTVTLTGQGVVPMATISVSSLAFASQVVGTTSPVQTFTLTNPGGAGGWATLNLTGITLGGTNASSFAESNTCGTSLAPGTNCVLSVTFDPTAAGAQSASISFADSASNSPQVIPLTGTGTAAVPKLSVSSLAFATPQPVSTTSAAQTVTLTNTGNIPLTLTGITVTGTNASSFAQTNTCGTSLAGSASCTISVTFDPTAGGALAGTLSIADNALGSPQTVALTGTGVAPTAALSATSLTFNQAAGSTSATQVVLLTNNGPGPLTIGTIAVTGTNASLFTATNSCGTTLIDEASCTVTVSFSPTAAGSFTATVNIPDNATVAQSIALTGTATTTAPVISLSSPSLTFTQPAESTSAAQTVTLTNTGTAPLLLTGIAVTGTNAWNFPETNNCGTSVAAGANCTISVTFNPSLAASFAAQVAISSNAPVAQSIALTGTGTGTLTINTSSATDWKISNGLLTLDWNSNTGAVFGVHLTGYTDNLVDTTTISSAGQPDGLYMDNTGQAAGTVTSGYSQVGNEYIDWWVTTASNATNPFTYTQHFIITANDTGFHIYSTVGHSATDIAGSIGQWQYVFRINLSDFVTTYTVNEGLNNLGVQTVTQPSTTITGNTDPGRVVSNAVEDLHGLGPLPASFLRQFYTKYDYSSYEYLHQEHGIYGSTFGAWMVLPYTGIESIVGGPTKQDLIFTNNILMMEALSSHFVANMAYTPPQGVATNRLFGPFYYHFNAFTTTNTTPASLYSEASTYEPAFNFLYDSDTTLATAGYVASNARGKVSPIVYNGGSATPNAAWTVLSDNATNFQYTNQGRQYWVNNNALGTASISGVVPGTYRLSSYVLGQWGEARQDNVVVKANQTTMPVLSFTPENFSNYTPIWTIGTPDRSGHEFLHGEDSNGNDFRNYWGAYNFWQDFAANKGTQIYYATAEGSTPATNNPLAVNYVQWGTFDPGLFGGVYNATDDTTDGYNYVIPAYVNTLTGATGTNGTGTAVPPLTIHFTTTAAQQAQGQYTVLSVGLACAENDVIATLNGQQLIWHATNPSDCMVRSGLSGYYQWLALQWNTSLLTAPGQDNVLTIGSNHAEGFTWDALRMEITNTSAAPGVTGWNDYEWLYGSQDIPANDTIPNP